MVLDDDHAGQDAFRVHADEDLDRPVVRALERVELRRPERETEQRLAREGLEVRRVAAFRRERRRRWKEMLQLALQLRVGRRLAEGGPAAGDEQARDDEEPFHQAARLYRVNDDGRNQERFMATARGCLRAV